MTRSEDHSEPFPLAHPALWIALAILPVLVGWWIFRKQLTDSNHLMLFATLGPGWIASVYYLSQLSSRKRRSAGSKHLANAGFFYDILSAEVLRQSMSEVAHPDTPYTPRTGSLPEHEKILEAMKGFQHIILLGRTGIGKTREAIELIAAIQSRAADKVTVLRPQGPLEVPREMPVNRLNTRIVILFIDNLPTKYFEPSRFNDPAELSGLSVIQADFHQRLSDTIATFSAYYGTRFHVVATATGELIRQKLAADRALWADFCVYELPDFDFTARDLEDMNTC
jgi:hypothetical protein